MIHFILNQKEISTALPPGTALLDFIRYHSHLTGTKIGCREGDCGACTVLTGELVNGELVYRSATCCLMALGNAHGKHIVTIEGLNMQGLNAVQQALSDAGATQCGFCTPGFVVSLAGFCLSAKEPSYKNAIASIDGNICRCTGYKSIERAAANLVRLLDGRGEEDPLAYACFNNLLPGYFNDMKERLQRFSFSFNGEETAKKDPPLFLGGGTDLYVQRHETIVQDDFQFLMRKNDLKGIIRAGNACVIGAAATVTDMVESPVFQGYFPLLNPFVKLVSSTPIRNMATIAGNFVNASPIGDLTIFFLALNAQLVLRNGDASRTVSLRNFYKGYKHIDKEADEYLEIIWFELPPDESLFNFEKVSKRTHLDIASVNSAINLAMEGDMIKRASLSAGGVGPVPLYLSETSLFLNDKMLSEQVIEDSIAIALTEISPISDARGTAAYKTLLLSQLIKAHFISLFPALQIEKLLKV